ncbi:hypothetical protein FOL47_003615 [Perkinsus chesapeaki]|uniref:Uncharacterized protein n=1 Tax=Perkinsus chesapeaki TaxID=330153 RepID=A0A7J6M745_PERCH|nr:hypothetical protein FOL47_003615 [Perkinsus chesapeaki]
MRSLVNFFLIAVTASDNACNDGDKAKIGGSLFPGFLWHCGMQAMLDPSKISQCLEQGCGLTNGCADCFTESGKCVLDDCLSDCMTPSNPSCKTCMDKNCNPAFLKCSGLSGDVG